MDDPLKQEVAKLALALAQRHRERLAAAGTFVDLEALTAQIGDELARQVASYELARRSDILTRQPTHACPDCGKQCPVEPDLEPIILQGMRGEIEYAEPRCHCSRCRRDFFPSGRPIGAPAAGECHAEDAGEDGLGGNQSR